MPSKGLGEPSTAFRPQKLPLDASALALRSEGCHCVADAELENRYNVLRAEEHARREGKCGQEWSTEVATREENSSRNRYASVVPWDHSRVILPVKEGYNDYINASWVQMGSRTYIATQGPLGSTVQDFWQMVYAYGGEPAVIIMLTPLYEHAVEKCCQYWPDSKNHPIVMQGGDRGYRFGLTVSLQNHHKHAHYRYSTFTLSPSDKSMPERTIHHVYYNSWLDYSKPNADADLRSLIHLVNNKLRNRASPPIVHCSAGIGRTGTFIALDALLCRIDTDILPVVTPRISPVWRGSQHELQYRDSLFTGKEDMHVESDSNSPLLSKFDVAAASVAPSIHSRGQTARTTPPGESSFIAGKLPISGTVTRDSLLSQAIADMKNEAGMGDDEFDNENNASESETAVEKNGDTHKTPPPLQQRNGFATTPPPLTSTSPHTTSPRTTSPRNGRMAGIPEAGSDDSATGATTVVGGTGESQIGEVILPQNECDCAADLDDTDKTPPATSPTTKKSSALSGPAIRKVAAKVTSVAPEVFLETPEKVNVMLWYDPRDPVMSAIRTMRKQRAKMVQGKQQLGYIYDQFEVGQQLARATHQPNQAIRRRSTISSIASSPASTTSVGSHSKSHKILSLMGLRRASTTTSSDAFTTSSSKRGHLLR